MRNVNNRGSIMNEYKVVYWEDTSGDFGRLIKTKFEDKVNELAQEGWIVKFSNITSMPTEKRLSIYALLEREKIPAPFRARSKNGP